ncbi:hypothetical protein N9115_01215 [bacterium]|nr:hypothetical protein [Akkermansiaceae bacterium]MDB4310395.1 hypothetical protein [Akkermansiaceae bacterium]MDB4440200.1 hypothetical protein [bacterium]MDB4577268.1 hypothetical protein [bacterium]
MGKRFIILGIIGLVTGGILHFLSYPTEKKITENRNVKKSLMILYGDPNGLLYDREKYNKMKESDPTRRNSKYTTGSYIAYGVGGLFFLIGIAIGPEKKAADKEEKAS